MRFKQVNPKPLRHQYRLYSPTALTNAYKFVKEQKSAVLKAARMFSVPENTLRDNINGKIDPENVTMGGVPLFRQYDESKLVSHFTTMACYGYGYTRQECVDIATDYAIQLGLRTKDKPLSIKWFKGFISRWPEMKVVKPRGLEHVRAKMASEAALSSYFENLEECIARHNLSDKPHLIFNLDEKGIQVDHKPPHIVAGASFTAQSVTSGKGKTVTLLGCGSASGSSIPPYFVFPGKRFNPDLMMGAIPGAAGTVTESGWSNSEVFRHYLENHFLKFVPGRCNEKVLLIVDGHRSHTAVGLSEWAEQKNIILFILPAHTSHITQPLDVACYGPFERMYNNQCHKVIRESSAAITKYNICEMSCKVYQRALSSENIQAGFKRTGIFPLSRYAIPHVEIQPSEIFIATRYDDDNDSDATVEGGIDTSSEPDMFEKIQLKLKAVKSEPKKTRNTVSKIVSGQELTSEKIQKQINNHVEQKRTSTKPKTCKKEKNKSRSKTVKKQSSCLSPPPGPSHINLINSCPETTDDEMSESEKCCKCKRFNPAALANCVSLTFTKWGQCDGIRDGNPCRHWTHLIYCTDVRVLRRGDKFFCPCCLEE